MVSTDLGAGPSGSAYLAIDPSTGTRVLLLTIDARVKGRRKDSAIANALHAWCATTVAQPSLPRPLAAGVETGIPYVVYPYLPGTSLDELVQQSGPQPLAEVVRILTPVAAAIDDAAIAGAHHGALTPSDILVSEETVSVTRFGLVDTLTQAGLTFPVQPPYASPERVADTPPTAAADVYSLAAIALMMIGGAAPELRSDRGESSTGGPQLALPLSASEEEALRAVVGVDARLLRTAISRALSEDPVQRPASASELVEGLRSAMVQEPTSSLPATSEILTMRPVRGSKRTLAFAALGIAVVGALFVGGLRWGERDNEGGSKPAVSDTPDTTPAPPAVLTITPPPTTSSEPPPRPAEAKSAPAPSSPQSRPRTANRRATRAGSVETRTDRQRRRERSTAAATVDPNAPGTLFVTSDPSGAQLFVDDELVGTTPLLMSNVAVGAHQIRVELSGFQSFSSTVEVEPGKRSRVTAKLAQQ